MDRFNFDVEASLPTLFNYFLIILNSAIIGAICLGGWEELGKWRWHWAVLGCILFFLAFDEAAQVHEKAGQFFDPVGPYKLAWVIAGAMFAGLVGVIYLPFLWGIRKPYGAYIFLAGCIYLCGAIGFEIVGSVFTNTVGRGAAYQFVAMLEEVLEMLGQTLLCYTLLMFGADLGIQIRFSRPPELQNRRTGQ